MTEIKDFGRAPTDTIVFKVQDQEYEARLRMAFTTLTEIASTSGNQTGPESLEAARDFLRRVVLPESWERMSEAMASNDPDIMLDTAQVTDIVQWLMPQVTRRPTKPVGDSSD